MAGDHQYDCYRAMRALTHGDWDAYVPLTNIVWLHYLARKLLLEKKLKKPGSASLGSGRPHQRGIGLPVGSPRRSRSGVLSVRQLGSRPSKADEAFLRREKACFEALQLAESTLGETVENAVGAASRASSRANARKGRVSAVAETKEEGELPFRDVREFTQWWQDL
jgi:serine/threonine-protein kinase haspin